MADADLTSIKAAIDSISARFDDLYEDVDRLRRERGSRHRARRTPSRSPVRSRSPHRTSSRRGSRSRDTPRSREPSTPSWARMSARRDDENYADEENDERRDADSGDETAFGDLVSVSEETNQLLTTACTRSVSNETRKKIRGGYQLPRVVATKSPNLDTFMKAEVPANAKSLDKDLAKVQSLFLDALAPITAMLERDLSPSGVYEAAAAAAELIGNASARMSQLRREKIVGAMNKSLLPLAKDEGPFSKAPPHLFGSDFAQRSHDYLKQVKAMRSSLPAKSGQSSSRDHYDNRKFFRGGPASKRSGPRNGRGGASNYRRQGGNKPQQNK